MGMVAIYTDRFTVAFAEIRESSWKCTSPVLGDGALWQNEALHSTIHVFYENNVAKVVSEKLMARNLSPHCYAAGQSLRIENFKQLHSNVTG